MLTRRTLAAIAAVVPIAFLVVTVLAGLAKPGYDIAEQSVSELAVGSYGWIQTANFLALGVAMIAFAVTLGVRRGAMFAVAGACLLAVAYFPADLTGAPGTSHGAIHDAVSLLMFLALVIALAVNRARLAAFGVFALFVLFAMFA